MALDVGVGMNASLNVAWTWAGDVGLDVAWTQGLSTGILGRPPTPSAGAEYKELLVKDKLAEGPMTPEKLQKFKTECCARTGRMKDHFQDPTDTLNIQPAFSSHQGDWAHLRMAHGVQEASGVKRRGRQRCHHPEPLAGAQWPLE